MRPRPREAPAKDEEKADEPAPEAAGAAPETEAASSEPEAGPRGDAPPAAAAQGDGRLKASPLARRIARERGVDLAMLTGTGPEGRILAEDVERAPAGGAAPAAGPAEAPTLAPPGEIEVVQLSSVRKTIARRLSEAWTAPVFQLGVSADMTEVLGLRETARRAGWERATSSRRSTTSS